MGLKRKLGGGLLAAIGFMLSPLSPWNDLFVNIPLALAFASLVSWFYKPAFNISLVVGYWLTNVVGLILLHKGSRQMFSDKKSYSRRALLTDLGVSLLYTLLIMVLIKLEVLKPIAEYFPHDSPGR